MASGWSGKPVLLPRSPDSIYDAAFSPDGAHVALSGGDAVRIWRADGSGNPTVLGGNQDISVAFSPDGSRVVSASGMEPYVSGMLTAPANLLSSWAMMARWRMRSSVRMARV